MKSLLIITTMVLALGTTATAQTQKAKKKPYDKTVLESRKNHKQRIQDGIKDGELTKAEAKQIVDLEKKIKQATLKAKNSGGVIDENERAAIKKMQLELDKLIEEKKKNDETRKTQTPA
jgi:hypothetical protein